MSSVGSPLNRTDGRLKVTGTALFAAEYLAEGLAHAVLITSSIGSGRIARMDTSAAERALGVLAILTPGNAPRLPEAGRGAGQPSGRVLSLLQDDLVHYNGQPIGVAIADTLEHARHAASLVKVEYHGAAHVIELSAALPSAYDYQQKILGRQPAATRRGDPLAGMREADVNVDALYTTPLEIHNPMEPHATVAEWIGDRLTLHDSTQFVYGVRSTIANTFGIAPENVRVVSAFCGGAFGGKGSAWSHVPLAAMAAKRVGRPVKLVLTRRQMFGPVGGRPYTLQHVGLGARRDGTLTAMTHESTSSTSTFEEWIEPSALQTRMLYACPNQTTNHRLVRINTGTPTFMRAPGEASGTFALESAMDELAYALRMDPIELRLKNYAETDPESGRPWSSKSLRECYRAGAERFGWSRRPLAPRSMTDGGELVGWGMATATYPARRMPASALARAEADGTVLVQAATHELGTGTYTVMTQLAADALRIPPERIRVELGDTHLPQNPISAGSMTAASTGTAVHLAATALRERLDLLAKSSSERIAEIVRRNGEPIEARIDTKPGAETQQYSMHSFGAVFVEARVDPELGATRITRITGAYGVGRLLNAKTVRSQLMGGIIYGLGMALMEHAVTDQRTARYVNADLAEYHVPVNADVPAIDVVFIDEHDPHVNPIGVKGAGEIGITGVAAAVANAVYHATGMRVRDLPITLDKLMR